MESKIYQGSVIHRSNETLKDSFSSISSRAFYHRRRFLVARARDIRIENVDMSNEKFYEKKSPESGRKRPEEGSAQVHHRASRRLKQRKGARSSASRPYPTPSA
ncbi:hypothetical protein HAX54_024229, partial [Datura stramonium]|nr:hypothetical protein [Datura stramonium]